jgi:hypothetical protein
MVVKKSNQADDNQGTLSSIRNMVNKAFTSKPKGRSNGSDNKQTIKPTQDNTGNRNKHDEDGSSGDDDNIHSQSTQNQPRTLFVVKTMHDEDYKASFGFNFSLSCSNLHVVI